MTLVKKRSYLFLKLFFLLPILIGLFYILEYGFVFDSWDKLIIPFLLSILFVLMLVSGKIKRYFFAFSIICLAVMILVYLFNLLDFAKTVGSFGFSLLIITIILYIPQMIKEGYIKSL